MMSDKERVNILLVDDQPAKLLSYEVILRELDENLIVAPSATQALRTLLKTDVAVLLVDVCMPDIDGFQFAEMVRRHPRFERTAIIFVSAIHLSDGDSLKGYELGAVDYVPVPVVPELLRAKVRVFVDLYRKSTELERLNTDLEARVRQRTSELEDATRRQQLLAREVDHRAKNALAVVQSIVRLTRAPDIHTFTRAVSGRIRAMANAHTLLSESHWEGADLARLVEDELAPFQSGDRARISGPPVVLRAPVAQGVAMAIHELATNAAKYGALSRPAGRIEVRWSVVGDGVDVVWQESDGPQVTMPSAIGFGTKLIEAAVGSRTNGEVTFDWRPTGLHCRLQIPDALEAIAVAAANRRPGASAQDAGKGASLEGARVMVAEDEPLIAMMISDFLGESGAKVIGPFASVAVAMENSEPFDVALLDVHLGGSPVYPLADQLAAQGCPFVFATGYDESAIEPRFEGAPVLQKPIEPSLLAAALSRALSGA